MSAEVVNLLLFGSGERRRYTQETPILPEVWRMLAEDPAGRHDLLITPLDSFPSVGLLMELAPKLGDSIAEAKAAPLQSFVVIRLTFTEVVSLILPLTQWARDAVKAFGRRSQGGVWRFDGRRAFRQVYRSALGGSPDREAAASESASDEILRGALFDAARVLTIIAAIQIAVAEQRNFDEIQDLPPFEEAIAARIEELAAILAAFSSQPALVWRVAANRTLEIATAYSRATIKADAAYRLFDVKCEKVTWAVIDSGVDSAHPAFRVDPDDPASPSRVDRAYDLAILRALLDVAYLGRARENPALKPAADAAGLGIREATQHLKNAHQSYQTEILDWSSIEPLLRIAGPRAPADGHGTHVAGIIGSNWKAEGIVGMCPDIRLVDLRIVAGTIEDTEFAVIGALQLVRYLNSHNRFVAVHGVNLSLSIPHQVENYACGRTPVCDECERLVASGTTVVAAAGNQGYQKFHTEKGLFANYTSHSITDPGNAQSVITVGSTHRRQPHTYGVSYFSSRGPTGDGRMKPDLLAPGERIVSALPDGEYGALDGTSQAAPHVSAAVAMLMARYPELNRDPARIKQLLCDSATPLGRERQFEGHGLLDVLRALQAL